MEKNLSIFSVKLLEQISDFSDSSSTAENMIELLQWTSRADLEILPSKFLKAVLNTVFKANDNTRSMEEIIKKFPAARPSRTASLALSLERDGASILSKVRWVLTGKEMGLHEYWPAHENSFRWITTNTDLVDSDLRSFFDSLNLKQNEKFNLVLAFVKSREEKHSSSNMILKDYEVKNFIDYFFKVETYESHFLSSHFKKKWLILICYFDRRCLLITKINFYLTLEKKPPIWDNL